MFDYELFCKKLTYLRQAKEYNKYQMSIQANIHYEYYCDIENGKSIPNFKSVIYIANALHVNLKELLTETEDYNTEINNPSLINKCYEILLLVKSQDV